MSEFLTATVLVATVASGIRLATPYLLAALGETVGQKSGVLNLGVDGVMQLSAFGAYYVALKTGNLWYASGFGLLVGAVMGIVYGFITVTLRAQQGISGIGIFLFGLGVSDLMFQTLVGTPRPITPLPKLSVPLLSDIPLLGEMLFKHTALTYVAFLMVPVIAWMFKKTTFGMNIRAVGENPEAADSLGVSVVKTRYLTILIGNSLAGLAGAALVLELGIFQGNLTQGLGFIAVALVYFGAWRPIVVMAGALLYGLVAATVLQWKARGIIPREASHLTAMAPALLTVIALVLTAGRARGPTALTRPFVRGE